MKKWEIGLILLIVGFVIVLISFGLGETQVCYVGFFGGFIAFLGIYIMVARFKKWSFE